VVGPACAGVNFLVISFLCVYFSFARHFPRGRTRWLAASLLISFVATIFANGLRIFVSAHLWDADIYGHGITREAMHLRVSAHTRQPRRRCSGMRQSRWASRWQDAWSRKESRALPLTRPGSWRSLYS
jgi:exosortase/archaeosortase family protein